LYEPETDTKKQATQHGCLPSLLDDGDKEIEIVYGEEKNIKKSFVPARQSQRSNQEWTTFIGPL
jgi:hypothetical protein